VNAARTGPEARPASYASYPQETDRADRAGPVRGASHHPNKVAGGLR